MSTFERAQLLGLKNELLRQTGRTTAMLHNAARWLQANPNKRAAVIMANRNHVRLAQNILGSQGVNFAFCDVITPEAPLYGYHAVFVDHYAEEQEWAESLWAANRREQALRREITRLEQRTILDLIKAKIPKRKADQP